MGTRPFWPPPRFIILLSLCRPCGALSPPKNLTVKFLDFRGHLHWLPGPGNPSETKYSAMVRYIGGNNWRNQCMNTVDTACPLDIPLILDELYKSYDVRVRAETQSQNSNWTFLAHAVQPFQTLLSPPSIQLYVESQVLHVFLTYPRPVPKGLKAFTYNLLIRTSCGTDKVKEIPHSSSNLTFRCPLPGNFCLTASINHGIKRHKTTNKCVYLDGSNTDYGSLMGFYVGIPLLIPAVFGVITVACCLLMPRDHTPTTLAVCDQSPNNLLTPEPVECKPVSTQDRRRQMENVNPVYHSKGHGKWCPSGNLEGGDTKALLFPMPAQAASPTGYGLWSDSSGGSLSFCSNSLGGEEDADEPVSAYMQVWENTYRESILSREGAVHISEESVAEMLVTGCSMAVDGVVNLERDLTSDQHELQVAETSERSQQVCDQDSESDETPSNSSSDPFTGYEPHPDPLLAFNS